MLLALTIGKVIPWEQTHENVDEKLMLSATLELFAGHSSEARRNRTWFFRWECDMTSWRSTGIFSFRVAVTRLMRFKLIMNQPVRESTESLSVVGNNNGLWEVLIPIEWNQTIYAGVHVVLLLAPARTIIVILTHKARTFITHWETLDMEIIHILLHSLMKADGSIETRQRNCTWNQAPQLCGSLSLFHVVRWRRVKRLKPAAKSSPPLEHLNLELRRF